MRKWLMLGLSNEIKTKTVNLFKEFYYVYGQIKWAISVRFVFWYIFIIIIFYNYVMSLAA